MFFNLERSESFLFPCPLVGWQSPLVTDFICFQILLGNRWIFVISSVSPSDYVHSEQQGAEVDQILICIHKPVVPIPLVIPRVVTRGCVLRSPQMSSPPPHSRPRRAPHSRSAGPAQRERQDQGVLDKRHGGVQIPPGKPSLPPASQRLRENQHTVGGNKPHGRVWQGRSRRRPRSARQSPRAADSGRRSRSRLHI